MPDEPGSDRPMSGGGELHSLRAFEAFGRGVRTSLTNNASAYGFSVTITCAFGLVNGTHRPDDYTLPILLFAAGAGVAFVAVEMAASRAFERLSQGRGDRELLLRGAFDLVAVLIAVGVAAAAARVPGTLAWPVTAFTATAAFLLAGGADVLLARRAARRRSAED